MKSKLLCTIVLIGAVLFSLSACNRGEPDDGAVDPADRSTVFAEEVISFPDGWTLTQFPDIAEQNGVISFTVCRGDKEQYESDNSDYEEARASLSLNGTLLSIGDTVYSESDDTDTAASLVNTDLFLPRHGGRMMGIYPLSDGGALGCESLYTEYEADILLHRFDKKGNLRFSLRPAEDIGYDTARDIGNMSGDVFTIHDVVTIPAGGELQHIVLTTEGLVSYDEHGKKLWILSGSTTPIALLSVGKQVMYLSADRSGKQSLRLLDLATGKQGDTVALPPELTENTYMSIKIFTGEGYDLYVKNSRGLWGLDFSEDEEGTLTSQTTQVIDWAASGIISSEIEWQSVIDAETVMLMTSDRLDFHWAKTLSIYRMVPQSRIVPKTEIVLVLLGGDTMSYAVRDFNKASDTYRVVVRDYTQYEYGEARKKAFDTDIAAGLIPDMIVMENMSNLFDPFVATYERSPLLCDLTPLFRADADFDYDDLLSYITKPYQWSNERQLLFPLNPRAWTVWGHREDFPDGTVTAEEFLTMAEGWDTPVSLSRPKQLLESIGISDCVDEENAICSFDDGYLLDLLTRADALPYDPDLQTSDIESSELFRTGQIRLIGGGYNSLYDYAIGMQSLGGDAVPVGYFNRDGVHAMDDPTSSYFAVTEPSLHKAACVDFLQYHIAMSQKIALKIQSTNGTPYYRSDIADQLAVYEGKTIVINGRIYSLVEDAEAEGMPGVHVKITEQEAAGYLAYLDSIERRIDKNTRPATIYETEMRTQDGKPLDEKLKLIQSKVSIYLSEQAD